MSANSKKDINDVLHDVIDKISQITDHLRAHGENEAANQFSRDFTKTFQELYGVIAPWDIEHCLMDQPIRQEAPQLGNPQLPDSTPPNSWAAIAATAPIGKESGIIKFGPSDGLKRRVVEAEEPDHDSKDRRVVWVQPWNESRPLSDISKTMRDMGAIYSMAYAPDEGGVCIIFYQAHSATLFLHMAAEHMARTGVSPFGPDIRVIPGMPYPADSDIRRMDNPHNERRRLTFARQQLFSHGISEHQFRRDIEDIVGPQNIELLWLFNTGNATVVLSAVPLAKLVRDKFLEYSRPKSSPYQGVMVSFSHDPCERDMHLVSQIPGHSNYIGGSNNGNSNSNIASGIGRQGRSTAAPDPYHHSRGSSVASNYACVAGKRRSTHLKPSVERDGWQTVKKRR
ncbi:hypothetical protein H2198_001241 [Neophaeococcomyces mojaviensis]|uniref:Uncharacterized protein n=1 Tax=Neophaeococcomyces mojaviensis TaxID=3383035 RepID=A0ACC3AI95_9EURO|nr:hypothetical protein H2198_001241 [Knufia sp. JES_112]